MHLRRWLGSCLCLASLACGETEPRPGAAPGGQPSAGATQNEPPSPSAGATQDEPPSPSAGATQDEAPGSSGGVPTAPGAGAGGDDAGGASSPTPGGGAGAPSDDPPRPECEPIRFEDPELELAVREIVGKSAGPLAAADVAGLAQLTTPAITSLRGIECLLGLTSLDIGSQPPSQVTDLTPLRGLSNLVELDLDRNPVASLEPLGKLPKLERLFMIKMPVPLDLSPLAGAPRLSDLFLQGDTIVSFAPLGAVSTLKSLSINDAIVLQPESIAAVGSLEALLATSVFDDAAPLAALTKLQKLRIAQKQLLHFEALSALVDLRLLDVANTGVSDITPVASMPQLSHFFAGFNAISDVQPLAALEQLNLVALNVNHITDLTPLAQNPGIGATDFVYVGGNPLSCSAQADNIAAMRQRGATVDTECR